MTNEDIARFSNDTRAFIQGNPDLCDPQVEGWFRTRTLKPYPNCVHFQIRKKTFSEAPGTAETARLAGTWGGEQATEVSRPEGPIGAERYLDRLFALFGATIDAVGRYVYDAEPDFRDGPAELIEGNSGTCLRLELDSDWLTAPSQIKSSHTDVISDQV